MSEEKFHFFNLNSFKGFDLPDMFRQMTEKLWKQFSKERPTEDIRIPEKVLLECNELVLNGDTMEEVQRLPGENDVSCCKFLFLIPSVD